MRKFVAARTVKVKEMRLSEPGDDCNCAVLVQLVLLGLLLRGGVGQPLCMV